MGIINQIAPYSIPNYALIDTVSGGIVETSSSSSTESLINYYEITAGEAIDKGKFIAINQTTGKAVLAGTLPAVGVAIETVASEFTLKFINYGTVQLSSLEAGKDYYLNGSGSIALYSYKSLIQKVGTAIDADTLILDIKEKNTGV